MADSNSILMSCEVMELGRPKEIIKLLECPICQGVPMPPIWNCVSGHICCDQCKSQLRSCGLCRLPFTGGRNYFMEAVVEDCKITCPYAEDGCDTVLRGHNMKLHATECKFGPKIKWITMRGGDFLSNGVEGGLENGVKLYVIRAKHYGSNTPGKLYEYAPPGIAPDVSRASLAWGGGQHLKETYEVLVAPAEEIKWIPSQNGEVVPSAIPGGSSEHGETLYIGRFKYGDNLVTGKIHPSHHCCYIGVEGQEKPSTTYEILVKVDISEAGAQNVQTSTAGFEYYS